MTTEFPDKPFYKIGEVCQYTDTQPYVLRFWESEFPQLAPEKNRSGQRVYRRQDIELIFKIKKLLYEEEYTIAGARRRLEGGDDGGSSAEPAPPGRLVDPELDEPGRSTAAEALKAAAEKAGTREEPRQAVLFGEPGAPEVEQQERTDPPPMPHLRESVRLDGSDAMHREIERLRDAVLRAEAALIAAEAERDAFRRRFERTAALLEELAERLDREAEGGSA